MGSRKHEMAERMKAEKKQIAIASLRDCPTSPRKMRIEIMVDSARILKRIQPAPQGRAHRIRKRSNHVTIVVDKKITEEKAN